MTKAATGAWSRPTGQWISKHVGPERKHRPSPGKGLRRKQLRRTRKSIASRYYQLLLGHAAIGPYLKDKIRKTEISSSGLRAVSGSPAISSRSAGHGRPRLESCGRA